MPGSQDFAADPRNAGLLASVDGQLIPATEAQVSIYDAGFGMGDGVWEGIRLHKGALLWLDQHLDRLAAGAAALRIGVDRATLLAHLRRVVRANAMVDGAHLRLMVTRGRKRSINQDPRNALGSATVVITAEYKHRPPDAPALSLRTVTIRTSAPDTFDMRLNTHSRANYILALLEAIDGGGDEAVMLDPHGNIASCNATNLFWVRNGTVYTSGDRYCFNGITRGKIIGECRAGLAPFAQGDFPIESLRGADEVFVTGTFGGVTPVGSVDSRVVQAGGPVTRRLAQRYSELMDLEADRSSS